jgi:hypothetical protein
VVLAGFGPSVFETEFERIFSFHDEPVHKCPNCEQLGHRCEQLVALGAFFFDKFR